MTIIIGYSAVLILLGLLARVNSLINNTQAIEDRLAEIADQLKEIADKLERSIK